MRINKPRLWSDLKCCFTILTCPLSLYVTLWESIKFGQSFSSPESEAEAALCFGNFLIKRCNLLLMYSFSPPVSSASVISCLPECLLLQTASQLNCILPYFLLLWEEEIGSCVSSSLESLWIELNAGIKNKAPEINLILRVLMQKKIWYLARITLETLPEIHCQ